MRLRSHGAEEGAGVTAPAAIRPLVVGNQRACELLDVVVVADLAEQVPARGTRLEGVENDVAAPAVVELAQIAAVRIGNDGAIAARECRAEQLPDGGALAGAGSADQLEVLDLVLGCDREPRECHTTALEATRAHTEVPIEYCSRLSSAIPRPRRSGLRAAIPTPAAIVRGTASSGEHTMPRSGERERISPARSGTSTAA